MGSEYSQVPDGKKQETLEAKHLKTRTSLRKALWVNTWVLLSLAISQQKIQICSAVTTPNEAIKDAELWSKEVEQYESEKPWQRREKHTDSTKQDEDVIVVVTVDGTLACLSRETGRLLWKKKGRDENDSQEESTETRKTGDPMRPQSSKEHISPEMGQDRLFSPLVSTTTTKDKTTSSSQQWKTAAVPSVDGRVYLTAGRGEGSDSPRVTDLSTSTTVRELVGRAPFVDDRGRFYVGSRHATAAALDLETGEVLRVVPGNKHKELQQQPTLEGRSIIWLGRVDYSVSLYDAQTGESDVDFSAAEIMSVNDMVAGGDPENVAWRNEGQKHAPRLMLPNGASGDPFVELTKPSLLIATPNGNVALRNPETGQIQWVAEEKFDSPVAFAVESSSGMSLGVDILPDATVPSASSDYLSRELERQMEAFENETPDKNVQTIVGALSSGQLFAMPLGRRSSRSASQSSYSLSLPHPSSAASASAVKSGTQVTTSITGRHGPAHLHDVSAHSHLGVEKRKQACNPTSSGFPGCLVWPIPTGDGIESLLRENHKQFDHSSALTVKRDDALTIQYHPQLGYVAQEAHVQDLLNRKKSRTFFRVMASWLPPTMALIFVLSFELGRRQRMKKQQKENEPLAMIDNASSKMISRNDAGSVVQSEGVIQVTEDVLGYGGHGTVVYKGTLEGRDVAVKRMLKAYHASADREISLLIESDGHPNVVRYFLKEVRGDFVYLALELCDLSLHDLIGTLHSHRGQIQESECNRVSPSTKLTLQQIASGVRHLHSLRIVHRDLKPANILLAKRHQKRSRSDKGALSKGDADDNPVCVTFDRGGYIAKISDMGLGKQLSGQSSFGLSTRGNGSLAGQSFAPSEGSTIGGAGPGSVGWQAPEVMALRWSPDSNSTRPECSSSRGAQDSFLDGSPANAAATTHTSRSVDIFSLGCIFYCTLVPGSHPFGEWYEREANIMKNNPDIDDLEKISPEAFDLVSSMIRRNPRARPTAKQICNHPFFWTAQQRLAFLCDFSDRLESGTEQDADATSVLPLGGNSLVVERNASRIVGIAWNKELDKDLVSNVAKFRTYDPSSVRDCLRLIRNKHHHYDELSADVKSRIGSNPDGLLVYFEDRFPRLLMHCYNLCKEELPSSDPLVEKYSIPPRIKLAQRTESQDSAIVEEVSTSTKPNNESQLATEPESPILVGEDTSWQEVKDPADTVDVIDASVEAETANQCDEEALAISSVKEGESAMSKGPNDIVIWEGSTAAKSFNCRGWLRSDDEWVRGSGSGLRKRDRNITRCAEDPKFRTRLCNHWDVSQGTFCPMRRKNKCIFAHGPVELRVKEGKRHRWGKLVDRNGNNANPCHSGGEDTYGAARSIETARKEEGKWKTGSKTSKSRKGKPHVAVKV